MKIKHYSEFLNENDSLETKLKREEIKDWLESINVNDYLIKDDLSINVDGSLDLNDKNLTHIPHKFNIINGYFSCKNNPIITLKNCPDIIKGVFFCNHTNISSLEFFPNSISKEVILDSNKFSSLKGLPSNFNNILGIVNNPLTSLDGLNLKYDLNKLVMSADKFHLCWTWLETNLTLDQDLIKYNLKWIKENRDTMTNSFENNFAHLIEIYDYL